MGRLVERPAPDWADRAAVAQFAAAGARILGDDPIAARAVAARIWDRTPSSQPSAHLADQLGMVFSRIDCAPRWRERLPGIEVPTLVVHSRAGRRSDARTRVGGGRWCGQTCVAVHQR
jgi:hypothetical protein